MFPVSDVVSESPAGDCVAEIEGVEVEVEGVDYAAGLLDPDYDHWCGGHPDQVFVFAVGCCDGFISVSAEPFGGTLGIVVGGEVHI